MERTQAIFEWIFGLAPHHQTYNLYYLASPNVGIDDEALQARRSKESQSTQTVQRLAQQYGSSLRQVWHFLHNDHALYTATRLVERAQQQPPKDQVTSSLVRKSYGGR